MLIWIMLSLFASAPIAKADDVYQVIVKRQEERQKSHWTLSDWLATRDKMRLMDLWLAIHSPSPYEFYMGGDLQSVQEHPGGHFGGGKAYVAGYAYIFGLEGQIEQSTARMLTGIFHLRIFGLHAQSTNITLQGGLRSRRQNDGGDAYINGFLGVAPSLYIAKPFGFEGLYRHYFASATISNNTNIYGDRFEVGAFLEFKFTRFYVDYFSEKEIINTGNLPQRTGIFGGVRLYF